MPRTLVLLLATASLAAAVTTLTSTVAEAGHEGKKCGVISVKSHDYRVHASSLRCRTARRASVKYLRDGQQKPGFDCAPTGANSFYCQDPPKAYWAIRL